MSTVVKLSRRDFIRSGLAAAGGLALGFSFGLPLPAVATEAAPFIPNAFLRLTEDGLVTIIVNKSEMGQGIYTALAMIIAEELDCDWQRVQLEAAPVDPAYNHTVFGIQVTGGSTSIRTEWERLAKVGASARAMLLAAAARKWQARLEDCRSDNGMVIHVDGRRLSYGELTGLAQLEEIPAAPSLKDPAQYRLLGRPIPRLDSREKISGKTTYGIDMQLPGMVVAVIARPPVFGAKLTSFEASAALAVAGVRQVVAIPAGVAVVADGFWQAQQGRAALKIEWAEGEGAALNSSDLLTRYRELAVTPGVEVVNVGEAAAAMAGAARTLHADYSLPYLAHAPLEPLNCTVDLQADSCDIWVGTQNQTEDRNAAAKAAGLPKEKVRLHTLYMGGAFGRRAGLISDFVVEAVQLAKEVRRPVKVIWSREDDLRGFYYRPCWFHRLAAGLDEQGELVAWQHTSVGQAIAYNNRPGGKGGDFVDKASVEGADDTLYAIPNRSLHLHSPWFPVPVLWWRAVGHSHTAFCMESFIDEVATASGRDPFVFRQNLLANHPRQCQVLDLLKEKSDWSKPALSGRGRGLAMHTAFDTIVAYLAEVSLVDGQQVRVHKITCVVDCGRIVNPDTVRAQVESAIVYGLTATLHGEITLKDGRVEQSNFHDYPLLTIADCPEIDIHLVASNEKPGGIGEAGLPPVAPVVANGLAALTGKRFRDLPLTRERVRQVLAS